MVPVAAFPMSCCACMLKRDDNSGRNLKGAAQLLTVAKDEHTGNWQSLCCYRVQIYVLNFT
jgi:hypothetical protein